MLDHPAAVHSVVLAIHLRRRRIDRLHTIRAVARCVTVLAVGVFAATAVIIDRPDSAGSSLVRLLIGAGLLAWVAAVGLDFRVQAHRLNTRILQMRLLAVQDRIERLAIAAADSQRERSAPCPSPIARASA